MSKDFSAPKILVFLCFIASVLSCSKEEIGPIVDDELIGFVNSFVEEGEKRGVFLSTQRLEAFLVTEFSTDHDEESVCGIGLWQYYNNNENERVEILLTPKCWSERTILEKENLMYHELGHALLGRGHTNGTLPNQATQKSIMCTKVCSNYKVFHEEGPMREYYLDELFNQKASFPTSIMNKEFKREIYEEEFESDNGDFLVMAFNSSSSDSIYRVEMDSLIIDEQIIHGLNIISKNSGRDSIIVFRSFEIIDFEPHSNLNAKASIVADGFDGSIDFGISIRDRNDSSFGGFTSCEREYLNSEIDGDIEVEFFDISSRTELATIFFKIYTNGPSEILIDNIKVELLE